MFQGTMNRRTFLCGAAASGLALGTGSAARSEPAPVQYAGQPFSAEMGRVIAAHHGFDREFDVEWNFLDFRMAGEVSESLVTGRAHVGGIGSFGSIALAAVDAPVRVAFAYTYGGNRTAIVARPDSGIASVRDLAGKKVGSRFGGIDHGMLMIALQKEGVALDSVEIINMTADNISSGLAAGLIDAGTATEPSVSVWENTGIGEVVVRGGQYLAAYAFGHLSDQFINESPDAAYGTVIAYAKGLWWARNNEDEAVEIIAETFNQDIETVRDSTRWLIYDPRLKPLAKESELESAALLKEAGRIDTIPNFDHYHYPEFIERAERDYPDYFADLDEYVSRKEAL